MPAGHSEPLLRMEGVHKAFGPVVALGGVDLHVEPGEVHALVGENGAGKSTLMKVLSGAHAPDAGRLRLGGRDFAPNGPLDALRQGVAMIYQELNLALDLTVEANLMLGREAHRFGFVRRRAMRQRVERALSLVGHPELHPTRLVRELGPGARQLVEIARALVVDAQVVVMDEPTSSLSRKDTDNLFEVVRRLRERGVSVIYISHFLEEVMRIADRFTVLRDGATVATGAIADTSPARLVEHMVGRSVDDIYPRVPHGPGEVILELDGLAGTRLPDDASLSLHRGEILGIAGLVGAGRTEMLRALFGLDPVLRGEVRVAGVTDRGAPPSRRLKQGIGMLSENRKDEGIALDRSLADNVALSRMESVSRYGWVSRRRLESAATRWIDRLGIRCRGAQQPAGQLSGGNQQKVALARLLHHDVDVLLLDEPTRGIDVASKVEVYRLIGELAAQGKAILFVSSYIPELLGVCDRIAVMHRGVLGETRDVSSWSERDVLDEAARGART